MPTEGTTMNDPFTAFWTDFTSKMWAAAPGSSGPAPAPPPDVMKQMRQAFFDAMARYADEFMRSEAFLGMMKQTMDNALAWQQMMNQMLQRNLSAAQVPSQADADHTVMLVRGMEDRVMKKLEEMEARLRGVEGAKKGTDAHKHEGTKGKQS